MEENKKGVNLSLIFLVLAIVIIAVMGCYMVSLFNMQKEQSNNYTELSTQLDLLQAEILHLREKDNEVEKKEDENLIKAQEMVSKIENAIKNKEWEELKKLIGSDYQMFKDGSINNYSVDINDYSSYEMDDYIEYVFIEKYDYNEEILNKNHPGDVGNLLVIEVKANGEITANTTCSGI